MRVTLAYPWDGHDPDETVEVDNATGRRLLRDGKARPADDEAAGVDVGPRVDVLPDPDDGVTFAEVKAYAANRGVSTTEAKNQIRAARAGNIVNDKET
jgi:hypothetical protein